MGALDPILLGVSAACAAAWAFAGAFRLREGRVDVVLRALLGGGGAFGLALSAYGLLSAAGVEVTVDALRSGGWPALCAAGLIGLVEEAAKLGGIALAARDDERPAALMGMTIGVCAAFAALETATALSGAPPALAFTRALLGPVAHAVLSLPLGFGVAAAMRHGRRAGWVVVPLALLVSAGLHAAGDLALSAPRYGRLGFAAAMLAPVLALFVHVRWLQGGRALAPVPVRAEVRRRDAE